MNIGIDGRGLEGKKSGIGIYIEEIIKQINSLEDKTNKYIIYSPRKVEINAKLNDHVIIKDGNKRLGSFWLYLKLPKILKEDNIDVFWGTQHCLPKRNKYSKNIKFVLTIHDLAIKKLKTVGSVKNTIIQMLFLKKSIKNADKLIAISEATKNDIIELFKINNERIQTIYNGTNIDAEYKVTEAQEQEIKEKFNIEKVPYIFFISTIEPRKNIPTLIKAYSYVREKKIDLKLILAGGLGWKYEDILSKIENSKYKEDICLQGYISKEEKQYLFKNTKMLVYPSLYEGFGLPILEAMANKALVVTSNVSSLPEVGEDIAYYYNNVLNYEELGEKIIEVLNIDEKEREEKINKGLYQVKKFTWEKCAKETLEILKN